MFIMDNILTVDLEDWYHITGAPKTAIEKRPRPFEKRVIPNTKRLLEIFRHYNVKATFFVLGCVAEENKQLIREIYEEGHEISSHGYSHNVLMEMNPDMLRDELRKSKNIIREVTGQDPKGFRAPSFSITPQTKWAFDILAEEDFLYDSSIFLAVRGEGGYPGMPVQPFEVKTSSGKSIKEFPVCAGKLFGFNIPFSGGGYLRLLPYAAIRHFFRTKNKQGVPVVSYIHPRDIDPQQPRLKLSLFKNFKTYTGLKTAEAKLNTLLSEFKFQPIIKFYE